MYIIYDPETVNELKNDKRYVLLELDTFNHPKHPKPITAYCVIDQIPLSEIGQITAYLTWHQELIDDYKCKNWENCLRTIPMLMGHFNSEVDSFYQTLEQRIKTLIENPPQSSWDGVLDVKAVDNVI
jgi:hypothetical protein